MGADLCGYILIGPMKLDRKKVKAAIKELTETIKILKTAFETKEDFGFSCERRGQAVKALKKRLPSLDPKATYMDLVNDYEQLADMDPKKTVMDFVAMWEKGGYRDMMDRRFPGDDKRKILVCGERTWGDGPEPDSAWGITMTVGLMDLFDILGIE
jgi:hypothetical protein